jgi:ethanolamine ammonia-lyase large subunit
MYFETGQGSALSAGRTRRGPETWRPGLRRGRAFSPLLVNTVVGFIGPEYLYDAKKSSARASRTHLRQAARPAMGVDVC